MINATDNAHENVPLSKGVFSLIVSKSFQLKLTTFREGGSKIGTEEKWKCTQKGRVLKNAVFWMRRSNQNRICEMLRVSKVKRRLRSEVSKTCDKAEKSK